MIILDVEQGKPEWFDARSGLPTASCFGEIYTPTGKPSKQIAGYSNKLLAEWLSGQTDEGWKSKWMERGNELEAEARAWYEFETGEEVTQVGLCYRNEDKREACSPDGLVFHEPPAILAPHEHTGLEVKCPAPHTQIGYLLTGKLPITYIPQVQGSMWITGAEQWKFLSYCPGLPPLLLTVERDQEWINGLVEQIERLHELMDKSKQTLKERYSI